MNRQPLEKEKRLYPAFGAPIAALALIPALILWIGGCRQAAFYSQAIAGQMEMLNRREALPRLISDPATPEALKQRLSLVMDIRRFAKSRLALPVDGHYLDYVDLNRSHAVYSVFAAPEFSLSPKTWCYPVIGCAAYRGYFSEKAARQYADSLRSDSYDVYIAGVPAYSTLGWFKDPLLNTFIYWNPADLAALIFHELAHQILYVKDDTTFNESFAKTVEQEGVRRWLEAAGDSGAYARYRQRLKRQNEFVDLVMAGRRRLETLYAGALPEAEMRTAKKAVLADLKNRYGLLRRGWGENSEYDAWIAQPLNNAQLSTIAAYHDLVPAFQDLLKACRGDVATFYSACRRLTDLSAEEKRRRLSDPQTVMELASRPSFSH